MSRRLDWQVAPAPPLRGEVRVPGDKSISHRAIMLSSLAEGRSEISGFLEGEDTRATARIFAQLGVSIEHPEPGLRVVEGVGLHGLKAPLQALDCGNAGTGMRLISGVLAAQAFPSTLVGDESLSQRPMRRIIDPLSAMGAKINSRDGLPPLTIKPADSGLRAIDYSPPVASAQVKSAVLLAGLYAEGETVVREPHPTRDYTERMLQAFGWPVSIESGRVAVRGGGQGRGMAIAVPSDFSSAAFPIVAGLLTAGSELTVLGVGIDARRTGLLSALRLMGAQIQSRPRSLDRADIRVVHTQLQGADIPEHLVADMIDEFPALFVAAACATGVTRIRGAAELRVKESDRIAVMAAGLREMGIRVEEYPDGVDIHGARLTAATVNSHGDHRCAMALTIAAGMADGCSTIVDCANVETSFPGFTALWRQLGCPIEECVHELD